MSKIGIINCYNESRVCTSFGCFKAFNERTASFMNYDKNSEMICFTHCNGCSEDSVSQVLSRANRMKDRGVDTMHLATCIKLKCPRYKEFIDALSQEFEIVTYTHET